MKKKVPGDDLKHYPVLLEEYSFADFFAEQVGFEDEKGYLDERDGFNPAISKEKRAELRELYRYSLKKLQSPRDLSKLM